MPVKRFVFLCLIFFSLSFFGHLQEGFSQPPLPGHGESGDGVIGALSQFVVIINEPNPVAGQSFSITIRATDMLGNLDESFDGSVVISTDNEFGAGVVTTVGPFFQGERPHNINVKQATLTTITATNAAEGQNQSGTSDPFMVGPAGVSSFLVQECHSTIKGPGTPTDIGTQRAGVPFDLCITALDQFGNHDTGFDGTVLLEALNNAFGAEVNEVTDAFTSGSISWPVSVTQLSANTSIRAENTAGAQQGTSNEFNVIEGLPAIIEIIPQPPAFVLAGEPIFPAPSVIIKDNFGNVLKDIPVDVELRKNDTYFTFAAGSVTRVITDIEGHAEFSNLKISELGENYQLKFLVGEELEKLSGLFITVLPGVPTVMNIEQQPIAPFVAGQPLNGPPTIKLIDADGNGLSGYPITVAVSSGTMTGTEIIVTDGDGLAVFDDLVIAGAGNYSLTFSTTPTGVEDVTTDDFTVIVTSIDRLKISDTDGNDITDQIAGKTFDIRIVAYDEHNYIASFFDGTVDLTTNNEFGSEMATTTGNFVAGVLESHTVSLILAATGASITAVNSEPGQDQTGTSNLFNVTVDQDIGLYTLTISSEPNKGWVRDGNIINAVAEDAVLNVITLTDLLLVGDVTLVAGLDILLNEEFKPGSGATNALTLHAGKQIHLQENARIETYGDIIMKSDDLYIHSEARLKSDKELFIRPGNADTTIGIATGTLQLPASYFETNFEQGFNQITIGSDEQTGNITLNSISFRDDMRLQTSGTVVVNGNQTVTLHAGVRLQVDNNLQMQSGAKFNINGNKHFPGKNR